MIVSKTPRFSTYPHTCAKCNEYRSYQYYCNLIWLSRRRHPYHSHPSHPNTVRSVVLQRIKINESIPSTLRSPSHPQNEKRDPFIRILATLLVAWQTFAPRELYTSSNATHTSAIQTSRNHIISGEHLKQKLLFKHQTHVFTSNTDCVEIITRNNKDFVFHQHNGFTKISPHERCLLFCGLSRIHI